MENACIIHTHRQLMLYPVNNNKSQYVADGLQRRLLVIFSNKGRLCPGMCRTHYHEVNRPRVSGYKGVNSRRIPGINHIHIEGFQVLNSIFYKAESMNSKVKSKIELELKK